MKRTRNFYVGVSLVAVVAVLVGLQFMLQTKASAHDLCSEAHDLVFRTPSGQPINADYLAKHFRSTLDLAGLPRIRLYDLRHSAATIALAAGVSPKVVSEQLGHTSMAFTLDTYAHVLPHMQDEAAARIEAVLLGQRLSQLPEDQSSAPEATRLNASSAEIAFSCGVASYLYFSYD